MITDVKSFDKLDGARYVYATYEDGSHETYILCRPYHVPGEKKRPDRWSKRGEEIPISEIPSEVIAEGNKKSATAADDWNEDGGYTRVG